MIKCKKGTLDLVTVARIVLLLPPFLVIYLPRVQASPNVHDRDGPKTDIHGRPNPQLMLAKSFNGITLQMSIKGSPANKFSVKVGILPQRPQ